LATSLVRDVHPNAVFVELDLKRIGGIVKPTTTNTQNPQQLSTTTSSATVDNNAPSVTIAALPQWIASTAATTTTTTLDMVADSTTTTTTTMPVYPALPEPPQGQGLGGWIQRKAFNFASAAVGNALRNMYSSLGKAGFNPGEEFAAAIREGQRIDAKIVLGDQDVEYTLRRLTQALAATDLDKLLSPDAEFERSMNELLPGGPNTMQPELKNYDDPAEFKRELAEFVERLKSRDNVRKIIGQLREVAPALVQVMLTERDAFMAQGLDTLQQFEVIVAVMGIAHMDGVETNLRQMGWRQVRPKCPKI
jgi:pheromone shutdown protein TraB